MTTYEELSREFPAAMLATHPGKRLTYIPISEVITRMNTVLGPENWYYECVRVWREEDHPDWVIAHVRVGVNFNLKPEQNGVVYPVWVHREGFGGQAIKKKNAGGVVDLGDEYKGAISDALKKACQAFGVGLHLARKEEAMAYDPDAPEPTPAPRQQRPASESAPTPVPEVFVKFKENFDALEPNKRIELKEWWASTFPGKPAPSPETPAEALNRAIVECVRLSFNAEYVEPAPEEAPF